MSISQEDKTPQVVETARGVSLFYKNRYLYSKYDPINSALRSAKQIPITKQTLYVVASPLFCYGIEYIIQNMQSNCLLLFVEKEDALFSISKQEFLKLKERVSNRDKEKSSRIFFCPPKDITLDFLYQLIRSNAIRRTSLVGINGALAFNEQFYQQLISDITSLIQKWWHNKGTLNFLSALWYQNIISNLRLIATASGSIQTSSINQRAKQIMLCAAGESLETRIDFIKSIREAFYIICVDTALPVLLAYDITPELVVAIEAQHHNLKDLLIEQKKLQEITLFCDISANPCFVRKFKKRIFFSSVFDTNNFLERLYRQLPCLEKIPPLGNVGNAALYIAHKWNLLNKVSAPLHFAGYDFCYINAKSHAKGSCYHKMLLQQTTRVNTILKSYSHLNKLISQERSLSFCPSLKKSSSDLVSTPTLIEYQKQARSILSSNLFQLSNNLQNAAPHYHFNLFENKNCYSHNQISSLINQFLEEEKNLLNNFITSGDDSQLDYLGECFLSNSSNENKSLNIAREKIVAAKLLKHYS